MRFADIPGHEAVKSRLRQMADSGRIPHALLLEGPAGIGKYALARAFAQYIHCTDRTADGDSCGRCPSCLQHRAFNHIDALYSFPLLKKNSKPTVSDDYAREFHVFLDTHTFMDFDEWLATMGNPNGQPMIYVEEATELLRRLNLTAHNSEYKTVIMWLPERLRPEAANKLLKLVEEPHRDTIFIMTSDNPRGILGTIYSRTQRIAVPRYEPEEIVGYLTAGRGATPEAARAAADIADGSMLAALRLLGADRERAAHFELFKELMRLAWMRKIIDLRAWSRRVADLGREGSVNFYTYCSRMIRENFILNLHDPALVALTAEEQAFCAKFSPFVNERNVVEMAAAVDSAITDTRLNGNAKIIAFDLAVQMILLVKR
ncbi:MAG: DNA polymerase III subunit delta [Bacteroides sp.]|nr:DNA polymerase III subunit delta [Bacteroides sp.]